MAFEFLITVLLPYATVFGWSVWFADFSVTPSTNHKEVVWPINLVSLVTSRGANELNPAIVEGQSQISCIAVYLHAPDHLSHNPPSYILLRVIRCWESKLLKMIFC